MFFSFTPKTPQDQVELCAQKEELCAHTKQHCAGRLKDDAVSVYAKAPGACAMGYPSEGARSMDKCPMESMYEETSRGLASVVYAKARDSVSWPEKNQTVAKSATESITERLERQPEVNAKMGPSSVGLPSHVEMHAQRISGSSAEQNQGLTVADSTWSTVRMAEECTANVLMLDRRRVSAWRNIPMANVKADVAGRHSIVTDDMADEHGHAVCEVHMGASQVEDHRGSRHRTEGTDKPILTGDLIHSHDDVNTGCAQVQRMNRRMLNEKTSHTTRLYNDP